MDIYNRKERIVEKLINEEELTREEIIFLLENFEEVSRQKFLNFIICVLLSPLF